VIVLEVPAWAGTVLCLAGFELLLGTMPNVWKLAL
jgi:hypothetical protein